MKGLRRSLTLLLVPLLLALLAVPVAAASQKEKTNEDHASWLELDPVPATVDGEEVTISGKVSGHFNMKVWTTWYTNQFEASGKFSATIGLVNGRNRIYITGTNGNGRVVSAEVIVLATNDHIVGGGDNPNDPTDPGDPDQPPVTSPPLDCGDSIYMGRRYTQTGQASDLQIEMGCGTLLADGESLFNLIVVIVDNSGNLIPGYLTPVSATTGDNSVIEVLNPRTVPISGVAQITLRGKTVAPAEITVSTPDLGPVTVTLTPIAP